MNSTTIQPTITPTATLWLDLARKRFIGFASSAFKGSGR